jgi:hypothetical protein
MEKGHVEFKSHADMELAALKIVAHELYQALQAMLESPRLKSLLAVNDQKAFDQATQAIKLYKDNLFHT